MAGKQEIHTQSQNAELPPPFFCPDVLQYVAARARTKALALFSVTIALSGFPLGWDLGTAGNLVDLPEFRRRNSLTPGNIGPVISIFNLGCICACLVLLVSKMPARSGCLAVMRCGLAVLLVGYSMSWSSLVDKIPSLLFYCMGRFLCGCGCGALSVVGPVFISHLCALCRNPQGYVAVFHISVAVFAVAGNGLFMYSGKHLEQANCGVQLIVPTLALVGSHFLPQSPCDVASLRDPELLAAVLLRVADVDDRAVFSHPDLVHKLTPGIPVSDGPHTAKPWRVVAVCCVLSALQQLLGIGFFFYFGKALLASVARLQANSTAPALFLAFCNLAGTVLAGPAIARIGVRNLLLSGSAGLTALLVAFASLGLAFAHDPGSMPLAYSMVSVACLFVFFFASTWGPGVGMASVRYARDHEDAMCWSVICGWATGSVVVSATPPLMQTLGFGIMYGFGIFGAVSAWAAWGLEAID